MKGEPLLNALDHALEHPSIADLAEAERLALATYWLVNRMATRLAISRADAALAVGSMASLAADHHCDAADGSTTLDAWDAHSTPATH